MHNPPAHWGDVDMVKTITLGDYISVQGLWVRNLADGRVVVRVGEKEFAGRPVARVTAQA